MALELTFQDHPEYLFVTVSGPWTTAAIAPALRKIREEARHRDHFRVLVDTAALGPARDGFQKFLAGKLMAEVWGSSLKVAFVRNPSVLDSLVQNAATNRGAAVAVFGDFGTAYNWLGIAASYSPMGPRLSPASA